MALDLGELVGRLRIDSRQYDKDLDDAERGFKGFGGRLTTLATAAGIAAALAFGTALVGAMDEQDVGVSVAAQLGQSADEAGRFGRIAGQVYADNFGESVADVGDVLAQVARSGQDLGLEGLDEEFEDITARALILRDVFKQDVTKSINAVTQIMRNGLAPNAEMAFDIITRGVQLNVDKSEDLLDTFNEYSTQFRELGLDAEQALGLMSQGLRAGARDADTVADALKEFAVRAKDGSKLSRESFAALGLDADKMFQTFARGGPNATAALGDVIDRLKAMKDPVAQDAAAIALFGTKAEDMQDALFALDPSTAVASLGQVEGATAKAAETMATSASANLKSFTRQLEVTFTQTLGGVVLPLITRVASFLSSNFGPAFKATAGFIKENQEWLAPLAVTLGTFAGVISTVVTAMKIWTAVSAAYTVVQMALNGALTANPIGIIIVAIAALVAGLIYAYRNSDRFRKIVDGAFRAIAKVAKWLWEKVLKPAFTAIVGYYKIWATAAMWLWRNVLQPAFQGIGAVVGWLWSNIISPVIDHIVRSFRFWSDVAMWLWHNVLVPFGRGLGIVFGIIGQNVKSAAALFTWLGKVILGPIIKAIVGYFKTWGAIAVWLWDHVLRPAWNGIVAGARVLGAVFSWLWAKAIKPAFDFIGRAAAWVWTHAIRPNFDRIMGIVHTVGATFRAVFDRIGGYVASAFSTAVQVAKGAINGLIDLLNRAIGFINRNLVEGLNKVPGVNFSRIPTLPRLFQGGTVEPRAGGRPVIMGDGGEVEYGIPHSDMEKIIKSAVAAGQRVAQPARDERARGLVIQNLNVRGYTDDFSLKQIEGELAMHGVH